MAKLTYPVTLDMFERYAPQEEENLLSPLLDAKLVPVKPARISAHDVRLFPTPKPRSR